MAMKLGIVLILFLLALSSTAENHKGGVIIVGAPSPTPQAQPTHSLPLYGFTQGSLKPQDCRPRCTTRCSKTAYKKPCMFFCLKCCAKCLCVPPGTYGNREVCPCYNNWKTKRGGPKCP